MVSLMVLICISLKANDVDHLFMYLLVISIREISIPALCPF